MPPKRNSGLAEAPHYHGHRERLRSRFRKAGPDALADYEMLELILFRAIPQRDVKPLAKALIEKFGSFAEVIAAPETRLKEVKGLGDSAITELKVVQAAAGRLVRGQVKARAVLSSWSSVLAPGSAGVDSPAQSDSGPHRAGSSLTNVRRNPSHRWWRPVAR